MPQRVLGEFEHQVLLAILRKGSQSYSVEIVLEIEERTGREVATAAVLVALRRLKDKDYLEDQWMEPGTQGAHGRRYFSLTAKALEEMSGARQRYLNLWDGVESLLDDADADAVGGRS